jgi:hypothetical protein
MWESEQLNDFVPEFARKQAAAGECLFNGRSQHHQMQCDANRILQFRIEDEVIVDGLETEIGLVRPFFEGSGSRRRLSHRAMTIARSMNGRGIRSLVERGT